MLRLAGVALENGGEIPVQDSIHALYESLARGMVLLVQAGADDAGKEE